MARPRIQTQDTEGPSEQIIDLSSTKENPLDDLAIVTNEGMQSPNVKEYAAWLAFMEEKVTFQIGLSDNPNAEPVVSAGVNGEIKHFERNKPHTVARKFLDSLIKTTYKVVTEEYKDNNGLEQTRVKKVPTTVHNISVLDHGNVNPVRSQQWFIYQCNNAF